MKTDLPYNKIYLKQFSQNNIKNFISKNSVLELYIIDAYLNCISLWQPYYKIIFTVFSLM